MFHRFLISILTSEEAHISRVVKANSTLLLLMAYAIFSAVRVEAQAPTSSSSPSATTETIAPSPTAVSVADLRVRNLIERYVTDLAALRRFFSVPHSPLLADRLTRFFDETRGSLDAIPFAELVQAGRIDWLLLATELTYQKRLLDRDAALSSDIAAWTPFAEPIRLLEEQRWALQPINPEIAAKTLHDTAEAVKSLKKALETAPVPPKEDKAVETLETPKPKDAPAIPPPSEKPSPAEAKPDPAAVNRMPTILRPTPVQALRTVDRVDAGLRALSTWFTYYDEYEPLFSWWCKKPREELTEALRDYRRFLREEVAGLKDKPDDPLIGDPIGRKAILEDLEHEMIPYSPEELIAIAERELAWCQARLDEAASELKQESGKAAIEYVKGLHAGPGGQTAIVAEQAREIIAFLEQHELVTLPPLCKELWRLETMDAQTQRTLPFASYGGQHMNVAFAMREMDYEQKLMSMRGNNIPFTRNVTPHELIPGHHLQGFTAQRERPYRQAFATPFLVEGWALHWEMLLWDMNYPRGPEDRVGMLFWRMHRCARIIISLKYHLKEMSPTEMIDFLVNRIGHEREPATAEVRRYIGSEYSPLYQCAYMIGGLQLRALHQQLVKNGTMTQREFHDRVLRENAIPITLIRASLLGLPLSPDGPPRWRFDEDFQP